MKLEELAEARDDLVTEIKAKDERIHELEKTLNSLQTEFSDYVATVADVHLTLASVASEFSQLQPPMPREPPEYLCEKSHTRWCPNGRSKYRW